MQVLLVLHSLGTCLSLVQFSGSRELWAKRVVLIPGARSPTPTNWFAILSSSVLRLMYIGYAKYMPHRRELNCTRPARTDPRIQNTCPFCVERCVEDGLTPSRPSRSLGAYQQRSA